MHIGVLQCDEVSPAFLADHGRYATMFTTMFHSVDKTIECSFFNAEQGVLPETIDVADAYLITGSRHGVNDGFPWITQLEVFIRTLYAAHKKVIGICFGHQLIAKALGGKVIKSPKGWGVGMSQNTLFQQKPWMQPPLEVSSSASNIPFNVLVSHQDQVIALPKEAEVLAGSDFCPYYLLQIGPSFLSIQGHPEFTKAYTRDLLLSREDKIDAEVCSKGLDSLKLHGDETVIAKWIVQFLKSF